MEKLIKTTLLVVFIFCGIPAASAYDFYISGHGGISMPENSEVTNSTQPGVKLNYGFDNAPAFTAAIGMVEGAYRSEAEFSYQKSGVSSIGASGLSVNASAAGINGNARVMSGMVNAYYDLDLGNNLHPYLTGGVGFSKIKAKFAVSGFPALSIKYQDTILSYQIGAGIGYALTDRLTLDLRYRFMTGQDAEFPELGGTTRASFRSHNFLAGLRYRF